MKSMKKTLAWICLILSFTLLLAGCRGGNVVIMDATGIARGTLGDTFRAPPLDVRVISAKSVVSYGIYNQQEGQQLVDVVIRVTNGGGRNVMVYDTDFQLLWGAEGFADPLPAMQDKTLAPMETLLGRGETMEYHYVYPALRQATDFSIAFKAPSDSDESGVFYAEFKV